MRALASALLVAALLSGCPDLPDEVDAGVDAGSASLPCDVRAVVAARCAHCHSSPPTSNAPTALLSRTDFRAPSAGPGSASLGEQSVIRMKDPVAPMPPRSEPAATGDELAVIERWVADGMPEGECEPLGARPATAVCSTMQRWSPAEGDTERMAPGEACRQCHVQVAPERAYFFMGTVYPTFHEQDRCKASPPADAVVEILDSAGTVRLTLKPNDVGNFLSTSVAPPFPLPYTARVRAHGRTRAMNTPQTNGDCNVCHTEQGAQGAPGRIVWP